MRPPSKVDPSPAFDGSDPLVPSLARAAFESSPVGTIVLAPDGRTIAANGAFCRLYDLDSNAVAGRPAGALAEGLEIRSQGVVVDPADWVSARALRGEAVEGTTYAVRNLATGREFHGRYRASPLWEGGRFVATIVAVEDVTEATYVREALEGALSAAEVGTYRSDLVEDRIWGDANYARIHGLTPEEARGGPLARVYQTVHPDDSARVSREMAEAARRGGPYESEFRVLAAEGVRWVLLRGRTEHDAQGAPVRRIGSALDITARKEAEAALRESEARYRATFESAAVGIAQVSREGRLLWFNDAACEIFGRSREDLRGRHVDELSHDDDRAADGAQARRLLAGEIGRYRMEKRLVRGDGSDAWVDLSVSLVRGEGGEPLYFVSVFEDVTARRRIEEDLRRTQESLGLAMRGGRMGWWRRDLVTQEVVWSRELEAIFGLEPGAFDGSRQTFLDFVHPEERAYVDAVVRNALAKEEDYAVEFRFRRVDGSEGWMEGRGRAFYDASGAPVASYGIGVDVTARKAEEAALRRSGETFERLVRNSPLGVYAVDADFRLALVSQGAQRIFENVRPLLGRDFAEIMRTVWAEPFASEAIRLFRHTLDTGEPYHAPRTTERRQDLGDTESYDWKIERIAMPDGRLGIVCHFYDLSERQRYEAELERAVAARTEELTRANRDLNEFAYSVAHDIRAPLRAIVSTSRILMDDLADRLSPDERDVLERQGKNAVRLAKIVDDLLGFARLANSELRKTAFDLTAVAREAGQEVARRWGRGEIAVAEGLRAVGDPSLVGYALTNLLDNAVKFSPGGGTVRVGEEGGAFFVRDEGVGFDMAHAPKLFVAFERLVGQEAFAGTGVGLANVKRIVERHGGRIWAESAPGKGATFWFTLG